MPSWCPNPSPSPSPSPSPTNPNPNPNQVPLKLHGEDVVNQLRMSGMLDAVKLIQAGYPTRTPNEA